MRRRIEAAAIAAGGVMAATAEYGTTKSPGAASADAQFRSTGFLLGFALGGFFDGILLHQILQWHHLLSGVESAPFADLRVQVLADGLFHALMYLIAIIGLWMLWRRRRGFGETGADRTLIAWGLIGFGTWHIVDALLSHWLLGIHRIRMDSGDPLFWDVLWLVVFGLVPVAVGWLLQRGGADSSGDSSADGSSRGNRRATVPAVLALAVLTAGPVAALPPPDLSTVMVLFRPSMTPEEVFRAVAAVDGAVVWNDPSGKLWAIDLPPDRSSISGAGALYRHGALIVGNGLLPVGCFNWSAPGTDI